MTLRSIITRTQLKAGPAGSHHDDMVLANPHRRKGKSRSKLALRYAPLIAAIGAITGGLQLAVPPQAAAISGVHRTLGVTSAFDTSAAKAATAQCPAGEHVTGGGAIVNDGARKLVRLTTLQPYSPLSGSGNDIFYARAEAPNLQRSFNWSVTAYAICASKNALPDYEIKPATVTSSDTFQATAARCPSGTVAYSAGASTTPNTGQLGLQMTRTSGPLDISRATARESATGYSGQWTLISFAVCAQPRGQIHAANNVVAGAQATTLCSSGFLTHGAGGGGGLTDGGPVWLQRVYPYSDLKTVEVALTGPTYPSVGGVVAHQTCAI